MVSSKVAWLTGIGAVIGTNVGWYHILKTKPEFRLSETNPAYLTIGAIGGAIIGGTIGWIWDTYG